MLGQELESGEDESLDSNDGEVIAEPSEADLDGPEVMQETQGD